MKINGMWKLPKVLFNGRFGVMAAVTPQKRQCEMKEIENINI